MPDSLEITLVPETSDTLVVRVAGEIDMATVPDLDAHCQQVLERPEGRTVVDLEQVTFIDSTGIATLTALHRQLIEQQRTLTLRGLSKATRRPFEVLRLDEVLRIE